MAKRPRRMVSPHVTKLPGGAYTMKRTPRPRLHRPNQRPYKGLGATSKAVLGMTALASGGLGLLAATTTALTHMSKSIMTGMIPNTAYPTASGRFGFRTAAQAGPAGISGLKFQFRRRR